jgi:hypothetical protein
MKLRRTIERRVTKGNLAKLSEVKDQICWNRSLYGFFVKLIYQFLQGAAYHKTQLANI